MFFQRFLLEAAKKLWRAAVFSVYIYIYDLIHIYIYIHMIHIYIYIIDYK